MSCPPSLRAPIVRSPARAATSVVAVLIAALAVQACAGSASSHATGKSAGAGPSGRAPTAGPAGGAGTAPAPAAKRLRSSASSYAVGLRVVRFTDSSRTISLPDGTARPRELITVVRYPALGDPGATDVIDARPARGPFPLVVFGHGFAVTPGTYARLLQSWARAGYVVAAPVFPLENANAAGGPDESDLVNQPADMSFVISRMLALAHSRSSPFYEAVDPSRIAVAGQSDGGDTALAVAYNARFRDSRVGAAIILSGAEIPGVSGWAFSAGEPPLLATQGTADTVNPPELTEAFFASALRPKYLLRLLGAEHLPPYTSELPQLHIVERTSSAFLDAYLKRNEGALRRLARLGTVPGAAELLAAP